jgi:hypothetical protein
VPDRERSCSAAWTGTRWPLSGSIWTPCALVLLRRAHPDIFDDALRAVINKAKQRNAAEAG